MENLIETRGIEKIYQSDGQNTVGIAGVNLKIKQGEFLAIVGPSGSGKSTLLQVLGCLDRPSGGNYLFEGKNIENFNDKELAEVRSKKIGFVFQAFNLMPKLSVIENVKLPLIYKGTTEPERTEIAQKMVDLVGLSERSDFQVTKLSGGQKQRVAIARALVNEPKIIFADEPTGSLDSKSGEVILAFFEKLHKAGNTIVLVTHESYVAECAQRIIHIHDGKIIKEEKVAKRRIISEDGFIK
jgi:putative ABC transport system ATP-binding protein